MGNGHPLDQSLVLCGHDVSVFDCLNEGPRYVLKRSTWAVQCNDPVRSFEEIREIRATTRSDDKDLSIKLLEKVLAESRLASAARAIDDEIDLPSIWRELELTENPGLPGTELQANWIKASSSSVPSSFLCDLFDRRTVSKIDVSWYKMYLT